MNELLQLKGVFERKKGSSAGGVSLPVDVKVPSDKLIRLADDLQSVIDYWSQQELQINPLVSVYYNCVIAKSNRVQRLLDPNSGKASDLIVGAKYDGIGNQKRRHIITYCVPLAHLVDAKKLLLQCAEAIDGSFGGFIDKDQIEAINDHDLRRAGIGFAKTKFKQLVKDSHYAERVGVLLDAPENLDTAFVTLYDTGRPVDTLLRDVGINLIQARALSNSVLLDNEQYQTLRTKAPYLISMATEDWSELTPADFGISSVLFPSIPTPTNEPIVGVIDTLFDGRVYFSDWVESHDMVDVNIPKDEQAYKHGTAVCSIIVDGPTLNPDLDDHCGRFRVRHFGVATGKFSSFTIVRAIEKIVKSNPDIKVWNLSFGSELEVNQNSISPEAYILDRLQTENDIIFIIAGTNKTSLNQEMIGAPADSINAIVVNSVGLDSTPADYSRRGPVLSFFGKPDVSYYGGTSDKQLNVAAPFAIVTSSGTSLAAPWITRKMAYLIHIAGLTREVAKALLIDCAIGWTGDPIDCYLGHGIVPIDVRDILNTQNDEIRFVMNGIAESYETYNYGIPVPVREGKFPYVARATLCYFPICNRNQGVDYTGTEMDLHFGRMKESTPDSLNKNTQGLEDTRLNEADARDYFRKWDNVKHIANEYTPRIRPKTAYVDNLWGVKINRTTREDMPSNIAVPFGLVVTLKEINGINRYDEFIKSCMMRGWLVNRIDVDARVEIYEAAEVEIDFDD